jgi:hypothetical protein
MYTSTYKQYHVRAAELGPDKRLFNTAPYAGHVSCAQKNANHGPENSTRFCLILRLNPRFPHPLILARKCPVDLRE